MPCRHRYPGRWPIDDRAALAGIVFVLETGITWNQLPTTLVGCSGGTCWRRLRDWTEAGVWPALHAQLLTQLRALDELDRDSAASTPHTSARSKGVSGRPVAGRPRAAGLEASSDLRTGARGPVTTRIDQVRVCCRPTRASARMPSAPSAPRLFSASHSAGKSAHRSRSRTLRQRPSTWAVLIPKGTIRTREPLPTTTMSRSSSDASAVVSPTISPRRQPVSRSSRMIAVSRRSTNSRPSQEARSARI
jgi:transposase